MKEEKKKDHLGLKILITVVSVFLCAVLGTWIAALCGGEVADGGSAQIGGYIGGIVAAVTCFIVFILSPKKKQNSEN